MASILREADPLFMDPPIVWVGLAMVHQAQHEIAAAFESEQKDLMEAEEHAMCCLKQGILFMHAMQDTRNKTILLCSCNDNTVRLYELPSFDERGGIFTKQEVRAIHVGPRELYFTGDGTGLVAV